MHATVVLLLSCCPVPRPTSNHQPQRKCITRSMAFGIFSCSTLYLVWVSTPNTKRGYYRIIRTMQYQ